MWSYLPDIAQQIARDHHAEHLAHLSHGRRCTLTPFR